MLAHLHAPDFRQHCCRSFDPEFIVCNIERIATTSFLLETRPVRRLARAALGEVAGPRFREIREGLRVGVTVDGAQPGLAVVVQPVRIGILDAIELLLQCHRIWFLAGGDLAVPLGQCPVPDAPSGTGSARKIVALRRCRVEADLVGQKHARGFRSVGRWTEAC
jgi:hypothetical protein